MEKLKRAWRSWTILFNSLLGAMLAGLPMLQDSFPQLQSYLPPKLYQYAMGALIVGNILLRFKTNKPLDQR